MRSFNLSGRKMILALTGVAFLLAGCETVDTSNGVKTSSNTKSGALIGAGGYGEPILTGIRLGSVPQILEGAVPAALLALLVLGLFQGLERLLTPRGLRLRARE
mgnify:CR=1 FL=1